MLWYQVAFILLFIFLFLNVLCFFRMVVTSFSSTSYFSKSEHWTQKRTQSGNIHSILWNQPLNNEPFKEQTILDHFNTEIARNADPHFIQQF